MSWLRFQMNLASEPSNTLIIGELAVMNENNVVESFKATAGIKGFQYINAQQLKGRGPIPECSRVGISNYSVITTSLKSSSPEIQGNLFYLITPRIVKVDDVNRGDFGIHLDANISTFPGSAGNIVLQNRQEWKRFEEFMQDYKQQEFSSINLIVEYKNTHE